MNLILIQCNRHMQIVQIQIGHHLAKKKIEIRNFKIQTYTSYYVCTSL